MATRNHVETFSTIKIGHLVHKLGQGYPTLKSNDIAILLGGVRCVDVKPLLAARLVTYHQYVM